MSTSTTTGVRLARPHLGGDVLCRIARTIASTPERWGSLVRYDEAERWYTRLRVTDDYEVWLLSWLPGQDTGVHDHGGSAGAFAVARGALVETSYGAGAPVERRYAQGAVRPFGPRHVHAVVNAALEPAVSVHVYAPALRRMNRYAVQDDVLRLVASERAGADW